MMTLLLAALLLSAPTDDRVSGRAVIGAHDLNAGKLYGDKSADSDTYLQRSGADEWTLTSGAAASLVCNASGCALVAGTGPWHLDDDEPLTLGNTSAAPDAKILWDTSGTHQLRFWLTDCDGGGTDCAPLYWLTGTDDAVMSGKLTVTGTLLGAGAQFSDSIVQTSAGKYIYKSLTTGSIMLETTTQTVDAMAFYTGSTPNYIIIMEYADRGVDFGHAKPDNPTIFLQSADATSVADWISFAHDQEDAVIGVGSGDLRINDDGGKGVATFIRTKTESVTFASAPGDASKVTVGSIIPDGAILDGVTTRVTTSNNGGACTGYTVGDGEDDNLYGTATTTTAGTTTTPASGGASISNPQCGGPYEITITGTGGNCIDMVVSITAHYRSLGAATSN